ncbi:MAG: Phosphoribosylaminoimidazole carboxylase, catalytic subunit [Leptospirillum sp. Group IV 'UBA BS']|jgi:phosphoribosylaminoimidazole carboxylase, PurE protein|nr:MAG: Phosphoribosylaminoimidazole carboxylase, catalytic subunit [Leptospirillum sp. Group IV 'UBA BS']
MTLPVVGLIMGSESDWETMRHASEILGEFSVPHESRVVSAHRTPLDMVEYAQTAQTRGLRVIIAGAGGAAHLPGMVASLTPLPVLGVPVPSLHLGGLDSLYSIVQMPKGIPVATFAIGKAGAANAGLFAVSILSVSDGRLFEKIKKYREGLVEKVHGMTLPQS